MPPVTPIVGCKDLAGQLELVVLSTRAMHWFVCEFLMEMKRAAHRWAVQPGAWKISESGLLLVSDIVA